MIIELHANFKKSYQKRIAGNTKLVSQVKDRMALFQIDPYNPLLKNHALIGKKIGLRAFCVSGDIRIIYRPILKKLSLFLDIGTHNQVY